MNFKTLLASAAVFATACDGTIGDLEGDVGDGTELVGGDEDLASTTDALSGSIAVGTTLKTTANLNLRTGPGTGYGIRLVIPSGGSVTVVNSGAPSNGFYNVKYNGTTGWSSGLYLKAAATQPPPSTSGIGDNTRGGAVVRAKSAVGGSYWWGHGKWYPFNNGGNNSAASCTGSCPNCSHSGSSGADCSGYVAKLWRVPSSNDSLTTDSHPYGTISFVKDSSLWRTVSRANVTEADALVYNVNGAGHIFLYENGDGWGWMNAYEAKGCSYGIVHNLRNASNSYHAIRHY
jgi:uncharacterized protein YraI